MSGWARLYRALRDALPAENYRLGKTLRRVEQDADGVTAIFADGTRERGDILVGADGVALHGARSNFCRRSSRSMPAMSPGARCSTKHKCRPTSTARFSSSTRSACRTANNWSAIRCRAATTIPQAGRRGYNIVWYRPTDARMLADICTDAAGVHHAGGHSAAADPPRGDRASESGRQGASGAADRRDFRRAAPFFQPIFDLESPQLSSAASRCPATPLLSRARMSAPAPPKRRSMPRRSPIACATPATT